MRFRSHRLLVPAVFCVAGFVLAGSSVFADAVKKAPVKDLFDQTRQQTPAMVFEAPENEARIIPLPHAAMAGAVGLAFLMLRRDSLDGLIR